MLGDTLKDIQKDVFIDLIGGENGAPPLGYEYLYTIDGKIVKTVDGKPVLKKK